MDKKIVLITGAAAGIGRATVDRLLKEGHIVYGGDIQFSRMQKEIKHENFHALRMDVTSDDEVNRGVAQIIKNEGKIDCLFANAGYCLLGPVELHSSKEVLKQFDVNVVGCGRVISAVLPHMRKARKGRIAITSSVAGHVSMPGMAWYPATKHAQQGLADGLRMEIKEFGIKVSLIEPGYTDTEIDIASFPTLDLAKEHPNAGAYKRHIETLRKKWGAGIDKGAHPDTIAKVVSHAFNAKKPKNHYHPHMDAKMGMFMNKFLPESLVDNLLINSIIK